MELVEINILIKNEIPFKNDLLFTFGSKDNVFIEEQKSQF